MGQRPRWKSSAAISRGCCVRERADRIRSRVDQDALERFLQGCKPTQILARRGAPGADGIAVTGEPPSGPGLACPMCRDEIEKVRRPVSIGQMDGKRVIPRTFGARHETCDGLFVVPGQRPERITIVLKLAAMPALPMPWSDRIQAAMEAFDEAPSRKLLLQHHGDVADER